MNKSLTEKISENTRRITEMRKEEKKRKNKELVFAFLEKKVGEIANKGEELFSSLCKRELDITAGDVVEAVGLAWWDTRKALEDLGFEIKDYPECSRIAIPEEASEQAQKLLDEYEQLKSAYENREEEAAETDVEQVIKMLEDKKYEVEDVDLITVKFESKSNTKLYQSIVNQRMKENGFAVNIFTNKWVISVIKEESE